MALRNKWIVVVGAAVLAGLVVKVFLPWPHLPDRPLSYLKLTDDQARQVEDWVEAHPYPGYYPYKGFNKTQAATWAGQDAFMRTILTSEQWAKYSRNAAPNGRCINPGCPVHGRVLNPAMIAGFIRRHLPPGWIVETSFSMIRPTRRIWITGRTTAGKTKTFKICALPMPAGFWPPQVPSDLAEQGFRWIEPPPDGSSFQRRLVYVKFDGATGEEQNLEALIRRAFLCDMPWPGS